MNREKKERRVAAIIRKGFKPFRKSESRRQPPWGQIRLAIVADLNDYLAFIRLDAARNLVARHGKDPLPPDWRPKERDRARDLLSDLERVSRERWRAMETPRTDKAIAEYRKTNLGEDRIATISQTEVTIAHQQGEQDAIDYLKRVSKQRFKARWSVRPGNCCDRCMAMNGKLSTYWRRFYPFGPPVHPRCRCVIEYEGKSN